MIPLGLKSIQSTIKSFVTFENHTNRQVDIFWINYDGNLIPYKSLPPRMQCFVNTYKSHPWIFKDMRTGEVMQVDHKEVYWPPPYYKHLDPESGRIARAKVQIRFPMRSLRLNALWAIVSRIEDPADFGRLEVPMTLAEELIEVHRMAYKQRNLDT